MLRVFDLLSAHLRPLLRIIFSHHAILSVRDAAPVEMTSTRHNEQEYHNWYMTSWGLISRDGKLLSDLREPSHDASDDPVYFAPTFQEVLEYLPLCSGFDDVFVRNMGRLYAQAPIYYAIDGDRVIYSNRFAAESAWLQQQDRFANVLATMSPTRALDHAALCAKNTRFHHSDIIASS
ncbi:hypothetical protein K438DRAFT_1964869 [Mycena galopus ATCC 62051]|nr:hypothetical protein K438DRAFT_1764901 [Mycena galopus ATCC 62051]KAF8203391.1 hypothetical protein K438DRAFT_1964869 [Mycena galopus ATCC 62051]